MFGQDDNQGQQQQNDDLHMPAPPPQVVNGGFPNDQPAGITPPNDSPAIPPLPALDNFDANSDGQPPAQNDTLLTIKQQALQQLSPLVSHLDQTPEEKFKTTMMMIQASDNQDLLKDAYEAAQGIPDEKVRAQALLDVVNEINYFTQHGK
jgi:hypothetical protein